MTVSDLTAEQYREIETLAVDYLNQVGIARRRGRSHPEAVAAAPKIEAYKLLTRYGFDPEQAVHAFADIGAAAEGITT